MPVLLGGRAASTALARHARLRWRPLPKSLIDRRGAALVPPILLAAGLSLAAVIGLAYVAGFRAVYASLTRFQWPWLCAVPAVAACRQLGGWLSLPPALASLPLLRETTRQATRARSPNPGDSRQRR